MEERTSACHAKVDANYVLSAPGVGKHFHKVSQLYYCASSRGFEQLPSKN